MACIRTLLLAAVILAPAAATAQGDEADAKVDCSKFSKKANGNWSALAQAMIELGGSKITIAPGDIEPRLLEFGGPNLHSLLDKACAEKKSEPSQGSKSEKEQ